MLTRLNLRAKLVVLFLLVGLLPLAAIGTYASVKYRDGLRETVLRRNMAFAELLQYQVQRTFAERAAHALQLARSEEFWGSMMLLRSVGYKDTSARWQERLNQVLRPAGLIVCSTLDYDSVFLTTPTGLCVYSNTEAAIGRDLSVRDYVQGALSGELTFSSMFYSDIIDDTCVAFAIPLREHGDSGEIVGTLGLVMRGTDIARALKIGLGETAESLEAYLVAQDGTLLTNPAKGEYRENSALRKKIQTHATSTLSAPIERADLGFRAQAEYPNYVGDEVLGTLSVVMLGSKPAGLVIEIESGEAMAPVRAMSGTLLASGGMLAIALLLASSALAASITKPILATANLLKGIAEGDADLSKRLPVNSQDEIGQMAQSFNTFVEHLQQMLQRLEESFRQVAKSADELTAITNEVAEGTHGIAQAASQVSSGAVSQVSALAEARNAVSASQRAISQVAQGARQQLESVEQVSGLAQEAADSASRAAQDAEGVAESAQDAGSTATEGAKVVGEAIEGIERISQSVKSAEGRIKELGALTNQIDAITQEITGIAEQTNLLALNAAIEAARAGDHGRGFAVVASEVRSLAERAGRSAREITGIVRSIQARAQDAVVSMEHATEEAESGADQARKASKALSDVLAFAKRGAEGVQSVTVAIRKVAELTGGVMQTVQAVSQIARENSSAASEMAAGSDVVSESMDGVTAVSEANSAASEQVSASVEQMSASLEQIAMSAKNLAATARSVQSDLERYIK